MNIFKGNKVRLRAKTIVDIERDKQRHTELEYNTELDRLSDKIYPPFSFDARIGDFENGVRQGNSLENCSLVIETLNGVAVGGIGVSNVDQVNGTFSYGLGISPEHQRKGYASEAIRLLLNYYFNELRFNKCNVTVFDFNEGSKQLHLALGFAEEGRLRESKYSNGQYYDVLMFGITKGEFETWKASEPKF